MLSACRSGRALKNRRRIRNPNAVLQSCHADTLRNSFQNRMGMTGGIPRYDSVAMSAKAVPVMGGELAISANASLVSEIAPK